MSLASQLSRELKTIVTLGIGSNRTRDRFYKRVEQFNLTRDQNAQSHFSVYFVPVQMKNGEPLIWIGFHLKAQQYLPPGGHIEHNNALGRDERCIETVHREFQEEFNVELPKGFSVNPFWISITKIDNQTQRCKEHFDIWYAINATDMNLEENSEFLDGHWVTILEAHQYIKDAASREAISALASYLQSSHLEKVE